MALRNDEGTHSLGLDICDVIFMWRHFLLWATPDNFIHQPAGDHHGYRRSGVNFTNILHEAFLHKSVLLSFHFLTHDWIKNHLKHLERNRLGVLIRPVWLWHHFYLVYWWQGSNPWPFDREPSLQSTRPQLLLIVSVCHFLAKKNWQKKLLIKCWWN